MEFVSFQNVNHFVPKQAEKEQKQSADRESFQDIMKKAPDGYDTISVSSNPWDGATGVYVACDILSGEYEVPNEMVHPFAVVTKDEVENYKDMGDEEIGTPTYDREWVRENLYK